MSLTLDGTAGVTYPNSTTQASAGVVLQVVQATTNAFASTTATIPLDDSIPQNTEGAEFLTCSITPKFATSKLYVSVVFNTATSVAALCTIALFRDSTADAVQASWGTPFAGNAPQSPLVIQCYTNANSTSSTTFKVRGGMNSAGTFQVNGASGTRYLGGAMVSSITITEIAG